MMMVVGVMGVRTPKITRSLVRNGRSMVSVSSAAAVRAICAESTRSRLISCFVYLCAIIIDISICAVGRRLVQW